MNAIRKALAITWLVIVCLFLLWIASATLGFDLVMAIQDLITGIATSGNPVEYAPIEWHMETGFPPCIAEDAPNYPCYWDAETMGNGQGVSFVRDVTGTYVYGEE